MLRLLEKLQLRRKLLLKGIIYRYHSVTTANRQILA